MRYLAIAFLLALASTPAFGAECGHIQDLAVRAALDDPEAQYNLAVEFWRGECVEKDLEKSAVLWKAAAKAGDLQAHNNLGYLLFYGLGGEKDEAEAVRLWRVAVAGHQLESKVHLGYAYLRGAGVARNQAEAYALGLCALRQSKQENSPEHTEMAQELLEEAGVDLGPTMRNEARERSRMCNAEAQTKR